MNTETETHFEIPVFDQSGKSVPSFDWVKDTPEHGFSIILDGVRNAGKSHALGHTWGVHNNWSNIISRCLSANVNLKTDLKCTCQRHFKCVFRLTFALILNDIRVFMSSHWSTAPIRSETFATMIQLL